MVAAYIKPPLAMVKTAMPFSYSPSFSRPFPPPTPRPPSTSSSSNHAVHEVRERRLRGVALPGVDRGGLHYRTLRQDQPMKSFARRQFADGPGVGAARANCGNGRQDAANDVQIDVGVQPQQC